MGGFAFVKITVRDLDGQTAFYQSVLGLRPVRRLPGQVVLSAADGPSLVLTRHDVADPGATVLGFHVTDLANTVAAAEAAGGRTRVAPEPIAGTAMRVAIVTDPEGHPLELLEQA